MTKDLYHVSGVTGKVERCAAYKRLCRYGSRNHFAMSKEEAKAWQARIKDEEEEKRNYIEDVINSGDKDTIRKLAPAVWDHLFNKVAGKNDSIFAYNGETGEYISKFDNGFPSTFLDYYHKGIDISKVQMDKVPVKYVLERGQEKIEYPTKLGAKRAFERELKKGSNTPDPLGYSTIEAIRKGDTRTYVWPNGTPVE